MFGFRRIPTTAIFCSKPQPKVTSRARRSFRTLQDNGHALAYDYNIYASLSLFEDKVDDQALAAAQQANLLSKTTTMLTCMRSHASAARGETAEPRQLLLEAMSTGNLEEPNSAIWYGFGRIYEEYDLCDAAAAAYQHVERPDGVIDPTDTFVLARARLKVLHANQSSGSRSASPMQSKPQSKIDKGSKGTRSPPHTLIVISLVGS